MEFTRLYTYSVAQFETFGGYMKRICGLLVVCGLCAAAAAQTVFTADTAVETALKNNISVKRSALSLDGLERVKNHAWNSMSPDISAGAGIQVPNKSNAYDLTAYGNVSIGVVFSPGRISNIKTAVLQYEAGQLSYRDACRAVELAVRQSFYGLLYEQSYIEQQERTLETARQQYEQNLRQYNAGRISELDVLSAQVAYEQIKPQLESARITFMNDMDTFKVLLGLSPEDEIELEGSLDTLLDLEEVSLDGIEICPAGIESLEKSLEIAQADLTAAKLSAYAPDLSVSWNYQPQAANSDWQLWGDSGALSVGILLPIDSWFPWSESADTIAAAKDEVADIGLQLEDEKQQTANSIVSALRQIEKCRTSIVSCKANVALAEKSYELALDAYNRGARDFLSLQDASDTLFEAQVALLSEAYQLGVEILSLEDITGVPFGTLTVQ